jgi:hypothetical protein
MDELIEMLRRIADEMENGEWSEQEAAVLITRDTHGYLTYCDWGKTGNLIAEANVTRRPAA